MSNPNGIGGSLWSLDMLKKLEMSEGGRGRNLSVSTTGANISVMEGRVAGFAGVLLARCSRCMKGMSVFVAMEVSGLMTWYASREKKRTFWPVPGVFGSRNIERTELYFGSMGVRNGRESD